MLQRQTVNDEVFDLLLRLQEKPYLDGFFLVGGTGLALQIGHRRSDDIDLFTMHDFNQAGILEHLEVDFGFRADYLEDNTIKGSIGGIKVDLLSHKYPLLKPPVDTTGIRISSIEDISAMKLNAVSNEGTRVKDFVDIYFLLKNHEVDWLLDNYLKKYSLRNPLHALKSLEYFEDADPGEWPIVIGEQDLTWERVKSFISDSCRRYVRHTIDRK